MRAALTAQGVGAAPRQGVVWIYRAHRWCSTLATRRPPDSTDRGAAACLTFGAYNSHRRLAESPLPGYAITRDRRQAHGQALVMLFGKVVRTSCPVCGGVDVRGGQVMILSGLEAEQNFYAFFCPKCASPIVKQAS